MRALFLCNSDHFGGAEQYTLTLVRALALKGHRPVVAAAENSPVWQAAHGVHGVEVVPLPIGAKLSKKTAADMALRWRVYQSRLNEVFQQAVDCHDVRVVHAQFKKEQLLSSASAAAAGLPVVWTEHGPLPRALAGFPPARALYRRAAKDVKAILCVSESVRADLASHGISGSHVHVCHNGLDPSAFKPSADKDTLRVALGVEPDQLLVGAVSRLVPLKGLTCLLDAIPGITSHTANVRFVIVGEGPERDRLVARVRELGVEERVSFLGFRDDVADVVGALDLFVSPSLAEGFGLSIVEAMSLGVPVLATHVGGVPEVLDHGRAGALVPPGNAAALARAATALLADRDRRARLGSMGQARVNEVFTLARMVEVTERHLLDAGGHPEAVPHPAEPTTVRVASAP